MTRSTRQLYRNAHERFDDESLGPLRKLPGRWVGEGTGWNMIALPFHRAPQGAPPYRLLMNQYNEDLTFSLVDENVPNRGLPRPPATNPDQSVVTLDYQQVIHQIAADDFPVSGLAGDAGLAIHHEPGLWLFMKNLQAKDLAGNTLDIARLASIPHGNSFTALGHSAELRPDEVKFANLSGLPLGRVARDLDAPDPTDYLAPYRHFRDQPFMGVFRPIKMNELIQKAFDKFKKNVERTCVLMVDTTHKTAGIRNLPFATREAEPVSMKSTFWIHQLKDGEYVMQYSQVIMMDFFRPREDALPSEAQWPHVSINTLLRRVDAEVAA